MKKYVVVGGGSGGHLTPLLAVAEKLKETSPDCLVLYIGQKGEHLLDVVQHDAIDDHFEISAGKFRRYHGESVFQHLIDVRTIVLNVRDFFRFTIGTLQAWHLLGKLKPDAIFLKGGFVSVPVGFAARLRRIPYMTHDSDPIPGLANRLTGKHAVLNATAMPSEYYPYPKEKVRQVGIPIQKEFVYVTEEIKRSARLKLGYNAEDKVVMITGGGLGAKNLNELLIDASPILLSDLRVKLLHLTGKKLYAAVKVKYEQELSAAEYGRVKLVDFTTSLYEMSAAADVVITRAGATAIAELAMQAKPCIVVPGAFLTGGQQTKNAQILQTQQAAIIIDESKVTPEEFAHTISALINDRTAQEKMRENLHNFSTLDSAERIAELLISIAT